MPAGVDPTQLAVLAVLAAVLIGALVAIPRRVRRQRLRRGATAAVPNGAPPPVPAVIANPTKVSDPQAQRALVARACQRAGWADPLWLETTVEDPGAGQTKQALAEGAQVVIAHGGDGTVRTVAAGLTGTGTPLGLFPAGTGNLLARNLGVPLADPALALEIALCGAQRAVDVGQVEIDISGEDQEPARHTFLVMAGLGFDAEVMASVQPRLKRRFGWFAYVVAGARKLRGRPTRVVLRLDDQPPISRRVRAVIIGNCGELTGGVQLMPDAEVDDGWLDVVTVAPRTVVGWAGVAASVLTRTSHRAPVMQHYRCRRLDLWAERPLPTQLDGDPVTAARAMRFSVDHRALQVRVPRLSH